MEELDKDLAEICNDTGVNLMGLVPYYFSCSEKYLKQNIIDTWVFGHTHVFRDFLFNGDQTRIISNADPRKKFFRRDFVFSV